MKALCLMVRKLYAELMFSKCGSKVTVKVTCLKFMVPSKMSCHKEHTCQIWKPSFLRDAAHILNVTRRWCSLLDLAHQLFFRFQKTNVIYINQTSNSYQYGQIKIWNIGGTFHLKLTWTDYKLYKTATIFFPSEPLSETEYSLGLWLCHG